MIEKNTKTSSPRRRSGSIAFHQNQRNTNTLDTGLRWNNKGTTSRHPDAGRGPLHSTKAKEMRTHWIPAFAGMTGDEVCKAKKLKNYVILGQNLGADRYPQAPGFYSTFVIPAYDRRDKKGQGEKFPIMDWRRPVKKHRHRQCFFCTCIEHYVMFNCCLCCSRLIFICSIFSWFFL